MVFFLAEIGLRQMLINSILLTNENESAAPIEYYLSDVDK